MPPTNPALELDYSAGCRKSTHGRRVRARGTKSDNAPGSVAQTAPAPYRGREASAESGVRRNREEEAPGDAMAILAHSGSQADGDGDGFGIDDGRIGRDHRSCFVVDQVVSSASVTHAVWGRFRRSDANDMVLGKTDQLQLLVLAPAGDGTERMRLAHQQPLHGTLVDLRVIPCANANGGGSAGADLLGILSDSGKLSIVGFDRVNRRFAPVRQLHLAPPGIPSLYKESISTGTQYTGIDDALAAATDPPFFSSLAVDPEARCVAVRCDTHVSVFFTSHALPCDGEMDGSSSASLTDGSNRRSVKNPVTPIEFDSSGTPLRPKGCIVLDAAFARTTGTRERRPCLVLLLMDEDPDDPDHPLRDRELRVPHVDVFHNLQRRSLREAPTTSEWEEKCEGIGIDAHPRGLYDTATAPTYRIRLLDAIVPRGLRTRLVEPPPGYEGAPFVGVWGFGAMISIGVSDPGGADGMMPTVMHRAHDTAEEDSNLGPGFRRWVWNRAWVTADTRETGGGGGPAIHSKTHSNTGGVVTHGHWVWRGLVATGSPTDKRAVLRVKLAMDRDGSSIELDRGLSVRLMGVDSPAAALALGRVAGRRTEPVAVFGRNGAVDVVSVPANSEPAVVSKTSRHAPDATALLCNLDHFDRVPPRGDITEIVSATDASQSRDQTDSNPSYILATGGALTRVALGVAASVVPVSPTGFESVASMWGLRFISRGSVAESLLVLAFSEQTRVFAVGREDGSTFEEVANGAGVDTGETTVACGEFGDDVFAQVTPRRVHLCRASDKMRMSTWDPGTGAGGVGAATVASHGRVALALPRRGSVVVLACRRRGAIAIEARRTRSYAAAAAQSNTRELVALAELSYRHEPSCLVVPSPSLASMMLDAMHGMDAGVSSSSALGSTRWSMVLTGTYGGSLDVVVVRERDEGYDSSRGDEVPPLPGTEGTEIACETTLPLRDDSYSSSNLAADSFARSAGVPSYMVPSAVHVARWGDDGVERPVVLLATRSGEILGVEPVPVTPDACSPLPRPPSPPPPPPRRLVHTDDAAGGVYGDEVEVVAIGVDAPHAHDALNPLELALSEPKPGVDARPSRNRSEEPVDTSAGEPVVYPAGTTAKETAKDGSPLRVTSRRKLCESPLALVPLGEATCPEGPVLVLGHGDSWLARRSPGCQRMSVVRLDAPPGIATATKFSPPVSDPEIRRSRGESALVVVDGRLALVSPDLEQSDAASRCDADARLGEDGRVSNVKFLCQDIATGRAVTVTPYWVPHEDDENDPAKIDDEDAHTVWEIRAWPPSSRPPEEAEDDDDRSLASDYVLDARPSPRFRVTALASCHPPKGVIGGIIAVGTSQLPVTYKRRQLGPPEPEGRLFIFRLVDNDDKRNPCGPCLAQAACIALPSPATCIATAGPGVLFAGSGNRVYCIRIGPRDDDDDVPARIPDDIRELGPGDPRFDAAYLSQSLSVTLVAQTTARRGVTSLAVGPPPTRSDGFVGGVGSHSRGHYPMLGGEADVSEEEGYVPVAIAGARESIALSVLKTVDTDAASRLSYPEFTPMATDATVRTVRAMAMRRRGEVVGVDAAGRIFVLQNRNAPAKKRSADEPEDENNGNAGRRKHGPCSPETNLTIAASFTLRTSPTAMTLLPNRSPGNTAFAYPEPPLAPDARARFDRLAAGPFGIGRSFLVGTAEGGVCLVAQVAERDWAVLREVQSLARRHPLTAPVLGAPHENARGAWPPRVGFGPPGPPAPLWPSVAEVGGVAFGSGPAAPEVIDGSLLREVLELPERAQRELLGSGASPLPVETVLGLIQRVLDT